MLKVIGSRAMAFWFHDYDLRPDSDLDVFTDSENPIWLNEKADVFWDDRLLQYRWKESKFSAHPDELYTIKVSHSHWDLRNGSWGKHMKDILFLQKKGAKLIPDLYEILYEVWLDKHGKKKMTFSESDEFFADAVVRKYDHDSLHESVAYGDHALYIDFLKPGHSVAMDMNKVWASEHQTLVNLFREEIYATALERIMVPCEYRASPGFAYHWALRRTITSLTKGKSSLWLIENFVDFKSAIDYTGESYVTRHHRKADKLIPLGEC